MGSFPDYHLLPLGKITPLVHVIKMAIVPIFYFNVTPHFERGEVEPIITFYESSWDKKGRG
jgi:hypothetical protein